MYQDVRHGTSPVAERPGRIGERQRAPEAGGAPVVGHLGEVAQQAGVVGGVVAVDPGPAGAVHAGRAAQRVDLEAAVVGQRRPAGHRGDRARLLGRVAGKGGGVLVDLGDGVTEPVRRLVDRSCNFDRDLTGLGSTAV